MGHDVPPLANDQLRQFVEKERSRRAAEKSLYEFVRQGWHVLEPGVEFIESWHLRVIAEHLEAISKGEIRRLLINIPPRHALALDTEIPTPDGFRTVSEILPGDYVYGPDGKPTQVLGKSEVFEDRQLYKVTTDDGAELFVDGDHVWTVRLCRKYNHYFDYTTEQLYQRQCGRLVRRLRSGEIEIRLDKFVPDVRLPRLPDNSAVVYPEKELPIDPYVLGLWLGDGSCGTSEITAHTDDAVIYRELFEKRGYEWRPLKSRYKYVIAKSGVSLRTMLNDIGIMRDKYIPSAYMMGSIHQRRELLKGLMDSDGTVSKTGQCFFAQSRQVLAEQVRELLHGLGYKASLLETRAKLNGKDCGPCWNVSFYGDDVFHLPRKIKRTRPAGRRYGRYITIEKTNEIADVQCLTVDRDDGLFLAGRGYIVTHNSKSLISTFWSVWEWINRPWAKFLCSSYSAVLSIRDNLKARRLIESNWFQEQWGDKFKLTGDQNQKGRFENDQTGYRIATSTSGSVLGEGGSYLIADDCHGIQDAQSDVQRAATINWFDTAWSTRLNNPKTGAMVVIMQRLHEGDVSGHILNDLGGWEHLCIPAEYDGVRRRTSRGEYDPRKIVGELICPERFGPQEIATLKIALGKAGTAGQLQQTPTPGDGGVLDVRQFRLWPAAAPMPQIRFVIQSYDGAYTEDTLNDPTACTVWGVFGHDKVNHIMLLDAWDEHLAYPELRKRVMQDWKAEYGGTQKGGTLTTAVKVSRVLVEDKSSGISLLQDLRRARVPVAAYNPGNASKVQRAHLASPVLDAGLIWIPESSSAPGKPVSWAEKMIDQLKKFPLADHDDLCIAEGSRVTMGNGTLRPIEKVRVGDEVMTPAGARRVTDARCTGVKSVYRVVVGSRTLKATGNHPLCLDSGVYVRIDTINQDQRIQCHSNLFFRRLILKSWCSMVGATVATLVARVRHMLATSIAQAICSIETCGSFITDRFPTSTMFTTSTRTLVTTISATLRPLSGASIDVWPMRFDRRTRRPINSLLTWREFARKQRSGTLPLKERSGILKMRYRRLQKLGQKVAGHLKEQWLTIWSVFGVSHHLSAAILVRGIVRRLAKVVNRDIADSVLVFDPIETMRVYNLTVDDQHCFFAEGVLTHNCDTFTQTIIYLKNEGFIELPTVEADPHDDVPTKRLVNPYAA